MENVEGIPCSTELEALVLEARLIRKHEPKYNRRGKTWRRHAYLKIDPGEAYPRIKVVRETKGDAVFMGPFPSSKQAHLAKEALEDAFPIRRCTKPMRAKTRFAPCALADMGRCHAPCDGRIGVERYGELVRGLLSSLQSPGGLLEALERRMMHLAAAGRFEEAAISRDRLRVLAEALSKLRTDAWLLGTEELVLRDDSGRRLRFVGGALANGHEPAPVGLPCPRDRAEEVSAVRRWLARHPAVVEEAHPAPSEPVNGGAILHRLLGRLRAADKGHDYPAG
jgi:DNA polymerase-3 subunit epsilon